MSILIKGMEMPRKCIRCPVNLYGRCLVNDEKDISKAAADAVRDEDCPLVPVPPHGRLIDADALTYNVGDVPYKGSVRRVLLSAPTIIPASGGAEDE